MNAEGGARRFLRDQAPHLPLSFCRRVFYLWSPGWRKMTFPSSEHHTSKAAKRLLLVSLFLFLKVPYLMLEVDP